MTTAEKKMIIFFIKSLVVTKQVTQYDDVREYQLPWNWESELKEMLNKYFT